ncbi:MAG: hypothetical protein WA921_05150 [Ahrensia sp.]
MKTLTALALTVCVATSATAAPLALDVPHNASVTNHVIHVGGAEAEAIRAKYKARLENLKAEMKAEMDALRSNKKAEMQARKANKPEKPVKPEKPQKPQRPQKQS